MHDPRDSVERVEANSTTVVKPALDRTVQFAAVKSNPCRRREQAKETSDVGG